jgi:MSHA biogenesis protein MshE
MGRPEKIRLGDTLVAQKIINLDQLKAALELQKKSGRRLGRVLIDQGLVNEEQICEAISRQLNIPYVNLKFYNFNNELVRRLAETQARRFRALVLEERKGAFLVGMADPTDLFAFDEIARLLRRDIEAAVVSEALLLQTIDRVYRRTDQISGLAKALEKDVGESGYIDFGALGAGVGCGVGAGSGLGAGETVGTAVAEAVAVGVGVTTAPHAAPAGLVEIISVRELVPPWTPQPM